jgi:hypothetical protein
MINLPVLAQIAEVGTFTLMAVGVMFAGWRGLSRFARKIGRMYKALVRLADQGKPDELDSGGEPPADVLNLSSKQIYYCSPYWRRCVRTRWQQEQTKSHLAISAASKPDAWDVTSSLTLYRFSSPDRWSNSIA